MDQEIILPDYNGTSIVNLMGSLERHFGGSTNYAPLSLFSGKNPLDDSKNVILLLVDGLGYNYFKNILGDTRLAEFLAGKMTSVFPSTTAAAMTSYYTGWEPRRHGILAWFTYLKELGTISIFPPMLRRGFKDPLITGEMDLNVEKILNIESIFNRIDAHGYLIIPSDFISNPYNSLVSGKASMVGYKKTDELFTRVNNIITNNPGRKLILAYWPKIDEFGHKKGVWSKSTEKVAKRFADRLVKFIEDITKTGATKILVTADHGIVDIPEDNIIMLNDHPGLQDCLTLPLCGEPRAVFCYVRPSKVRIFENYIDDKFDDKCILVPGAECIDSGYFGNGKTHPRLFDRVGDYLLLMKEDFVLKDAMLGEKRHKLIGHHGGISSDEMYIPLLIS